MVTARQDAPAQVGRFRLIRRIGSGGMGEVYFAQFTAAGSVRRLAAVKVVREDVGAKAEGRLDALMAEARLAALLTHPNVVQVLDAGVEAGEPWLAMEFVPGITLAELFSLAGGRIPPWIAARIAIDVCAALYAVHQAVDDQGRPLHIVHRDITPHNVLISWDGAVKVSDFGIARSALQVDVTRTGVVKGKLAYLSPEQASGRPVDPRSDLYALGVVLWELLAGRRLFANQTDSEILASILRGEVDTLCHGMADHCPTELVQIAQRALHNDPAARFDSALEMQRALDAALARSETLVGASDIAYLLAAVAPTRVREHEQWLRDAENGVSLPTTGRPSQPETTGVSPTSVTTRHTLTRRSLLIPVLAAVALATTAVTVLRYAEQPRGSAEHENREPVAQVASTPLPSLEPTRPSHESSLAEGPQHTAPTPSASSTARVAALAPAVPRAASSATRHSSAPSYGSLNVGASPAWAMIRVDGKEVGPTPTVVEKLSEGSHDVEARPLGKEPAKHRRVSITAGQATRVDFSF